MLLGVCIAISSQLSHLITDGDSGCMVRVISCICHYVSVRALNVKQLELSNTKVCRNVVPVGPRHAVTLRSEGQISRSQDYQLQTVCSPWQM